MLGRYAIDDMLIDDILIDEMLIDGEHLVLTVCCVRSRESWCHLTIVHGSLYLKVPIVRRVTACAWMMGQSMI
jgi:hypothetical protein